MTVKEPRRDKKSGQDKSQPDSGDNSSVEGSGESKGSTPPRIPLKIKAAVITRAFLSPSLLLLCLAGSIRNAGESFEGYSADPAIPGIHLIQQFQESLGKNLNSDLAQANLGKDLNFCTGPGESLNFNLVE